MGSAPSIESNVHRRFGVSKIERSTEVQSQLSECLRLFKSINLKLRTGINPYSHEIKDDVEAIRRIMRQSEEEPAIGPSASKPLDHSREKVRSQIDCGQKIRSDQSELRRRFCGFTGISEDAADWQLKDTVIPLRDMRSSLHKNGLVTSEDEMIRYRRLIESDHNGQLTFDAFKEIALSPSPLEEWVKNSVDFSRILTDALPKSEGCDYLRLISQMTAAEIENVVHETCVTIKRVLESHVRRLSRTFEGMDVEAKISPNDAAQSFSSKFEVSQMRGGTIKDFYSGLDERVGACPTNIEESMRAEHCTRPGSMYLFAKTPNNSTSPRQEWEIVMGERTISEEDKRYGRAIPDLRKLLDLDIAKKSKISREELVAVVLYTGPMFRIYNTILRKCPEAEYSTFLTYDNLFSTSIFVLASAVLKISKAVPLQRGLVLYRGLANGRELPDSFYRADENGCTGYVEWGFMSTTARRDVAIRYSKAGDQVTKQHILAFRVGAADRGACIRDLSQYPMEEEYIYVPCSFVEGSGPCYDEIGPNDLTPSLVRVYPVKVNTNLKTATIEELINRKKSLHLATFKYRIHEIRSELEVIAHDPETANLLKRDCSPDEESRSRQKYTINSVVAKIVEQCKMKFAIHEATSTQDYSDECTYRRLLTEMTEVKGMAVSKLQEWINMQDPYTSLSFRYDASLRAVHRLWVAFLEKKLEDSSEASARQRIAVQLCLTRGFARKSVHERNEMGETVLMAAAAEGRGRQHLQLLMDAAADVNSKRDDGVSAIWLAAQLGHSNTVKALCELKADVNETAKNRATPLYIAVQNGNLTCVQTLIEFKADLNRADEQGSSPMHRAAMNGHTVCIKLLLDAKAAVNNRNVAGKTPLTLAEQFHQADCVNVLSNIMPQSISWEHQLDNFKASERFHSAGKLIITATDISDINAILALATYARTGADVLWVMNYPSYLGINPEEVDPQFPQRNPGLGYKYSAAEVLGHVTSPPESYSHFMLQYAGSDANERMKCAITDTAFSLAKQVWDDAAGSRKGSLYFCIGGINSINPFSVPAMKNEVLLYSSLVHAAPSKIKPRQGDIYNSSGCACELEWLKYTDFFLDFNGPMSHWNEAWQEKLGHVANRIRGVFIMGGVYASKRPVMPSLIPNVLNCFSCATINQLYHPQRAADFFSFVDSQKIPTFVVTLNSVKDLAIVAGHENPSDDLIDRFVHANAIGGEFLKRLVKFHYSSAQCKPPWTPCGFYVALALVTWFDSGSCNRADLSRSENKKSIFYSNAYGLALVSELDSGEEVLAQYARVAEKTLMSASCLQAAGEGGEQECIQREIEVLRSIQHLGRLRCNDVEFDLDEKSLVLRILPADPALSRTVAGELAE